MPSILRDGTHHGIFSQIELRDIIAIMPMPLGVGKE